MLNVLRRADKACIHHFRIGVPSINSFPSAITLPCPCTSFPGDSRPFWKIFSVVHMDLRFFSSAAQKPLFNSLELAFLIILGKAFRI